MDSVTPDLFLDRFLSYVKVDTQSSETSDTYPSTLKQLELSKQLLLELKEMGLQDAELTEHGYVFATLPATVKHKVPTIGYIAHVDTSPEVSGKDVKPQIVKNYQGGDIVLKNDPTQIIDVAMNPTLKKCIGHDIVTTDGTTLLGADNKAGVAEIMGALKHMIDHPQIEHGRIRVAFTVDEEVGTGTKHFEVKRFAADYAYTIDGETAGEIEDETFCADTAIITIKGVNVHPGYAKDRLVSAIKIAADLIAQLPRERMSPETTEKREGYLHPHALQGAVETSRITILVRDFDESGLKEKEAYLRDLCKKTEKKYPKSAVSVEIVESYRNMKMILDEHPQVVEYAMEAVRRSGLEPVKNLIRGGTDGARLCFMGLPTPNIFTGGHNFHSKREWVSVQNMAKAVETIVNLSQIWAEKSR